MDYELLVDFDVWEVIDGLPVPAHLAEPNFDQDLSGGVRAHVLDRLP